LLAKKIKEGIGNVFAFCFITVLIALKPFFLIKTWFKPEGCIFVAFDYQIEYKEVNGKKVALFSDNLLPHLFFDDKDVDLPIKSKVAILGLSTLYTEYTDKHFFIDKGRNILYLKKTDLAYYGDYARRSSLIQYFHKKRREKYAAEALRYLD
jgi:hypothetical protein